MALIRLPIYSNWRSAGQLCRAAEDQWYLAHSMQKRKSGKGRLNSHFEIQVERRMKNVALLSLAGPSAYNLAATPFALRQPSNAGVSFEDTIEVRDEHCSESASVRVSVYNSYPHLKSVKSVCPNGLHNKEERHKLWIYNVSTLR